MIKILKGNNNNQKELQVKDNQIIKNILLSFFTCA